MRHPDAVLCDIRIACERTIDTGQDALTEKFVTSEDNPSDNPEARKAMEKAIAAAKSLLAHIDANYECGSGFAEVKEGSCLESK